MLEYGSGLCRVYGSGINANYEDMIDFRREIILDDTECEIFEKQFMEELRNEDIKRES